MPSLKDFQLLRLDDGLSWVGLPPAAAPPPQPPPPDRQYTVALTLLGDYVLHWAEPWLMGLFSLTELVRAQAVATTWYGGEQPHGATSFSELLRAHMAVDDIVGRLLRGLPETDGAAEPAPEAQHSLPFHRPPLALPAAG